ncbi:MAG: hypothetical protein ACYTEU_12740 [Planctomycetota bacterium]|jgi:hypothetical protein
MNTFIEKNKKWLKFYHAALRLSGWIFLTLGIGGFCIFTFTLLTVKNIGINKAGITSLFETSSHHLDFILFGLLGLGIAQLIRYLVDDECKSGFILRHSGKFLYAYVVVISLVMAIRIVFTLLYIMNSDGENKLGLLFGISITSIVLIGAKALILIGLAQFLERIMPVIEEHKSLV